MRFVIEPLDVLLIEECVFVTASADEVDCFLGSVTDAHQDECGDEAGSIEAGLAPYEDAIAFLPFLVAEIDGFKEAFDFDLVDGGVGDAVAELLDVPVGWASPGVHGHDRIEGKVDALGIASLGEVDDVVVIGSAHEESWQDLRK